MNWTVNAWGWGDFAAILAGTLLYQAGKFIVVRWWKRRKS